MSYPSPLAGFGGSQEQNFLESGLASWTIKKVFVDATRRGDLRVVCSVLCALVRCGIVCEFVRCRPTWVRGIYLSQIGRHAGSAVIW